MSDNVIVKIDSVPQNSVIVKQRPLNTVAAGIYNPVSALMGNVEDLRNVDSTQKTNGSVLVFKSNTNKWTTTTLLDQQILDAGEF